MKRIISLLLILITFLTLVPIFASNAEEGKRLPFYDIKDDAWYIEAFEFCYVNGYVKGTAKYECSPNTPITRESAVCLLARISDADVLGYTGNVFSDTKSGAWYSREVMWAYENGYTEGIGNGRFGLGKTVTREEFAKFLYSYAEKNGMTELKNADLSKYEDTDKVSDWAFDSVAWCVSEGIIKGTTDTTLAPKRMLTRSEAAQMIMGYMLGTVHGECEHETSEASCTEGSMCSLCGLYFTMPLGHDCEFLNCVSGSRCERCGEDIKNDPDIHEFSKPTCTKKASCLYCGTSYGGTLPHNYNNATCYSKASCRDCGAVMGGYLPHTYSKATCTQPETCTVCKATRGEALGHTTYNGECSRCHTVNYRKKVLLADNIYQMIDYPNGCESVSTVMALRYLGIDITVDEFIEKYLPMGSRPVVGGIGPDPAEVFCGDPRSKSGWGCYSPVIAKALDKCLDKSKYTYVRSTEDSLKELCDKYIDKGIPVVVWGTINMDDASDSSYYRYWTTKNGKKISYNSMLHCLLLVGYDKNNYYFNDPTVNGNFPLAYSKTASNKAFELLGNQSVAIMKK